MSLQLSAIPDDASNQWKEEDETMPKKLLLPLIGTITVAAAAIAFAGGPDATTATTTLDAEEQTFLSLINQYRQQNGLATLSINPNLQNATEWMSTDMGVNNYFSHTDSLARNPFQRMSDFGYSYNTWLGENIAAGTSSAQVAFDLWKGSPGHNANMLNSNYKVVGIARVYTAGSGYGWYWTNDFGGYLASTPAPTPPPTPSPSPSPTPAPNGDPDGDGFTTGVEAHVGTDPNDPCGNNGWPADLSPDNALNVADFATFIFPMRPDGSFNKMHHVVPDPLDPTLVRWDLDGNNVIGIPDLNALNPGTSAPTARPPMLGGQPAFFTNLGQCPFPP